MTTGAALHNRLDRVMLDNEPSGALSPFIEADREQAVADLAAANHFAPWRRACAQPGCACRTRWPPGVRHP